MKKFAIEEIKKRNDEFELAPAFIRDIEAGNIDMYQYDTEDEKQELLSKNWFYHSEQDHVIGLRTNEAKLGWA